MADPITSYATLQEAALDYLDRPDLAASIPGFVALAESRFNAGLRAREMEAMASLAGPVAAMPLPADYLEWIRVEWTGSGRTARPRYAESNSPEATFRYRPHGDPQAFTTLAGQVRLVPEKPGALTLFYYARIPALSNGSPSNWLLAAAPDAYLHATLAEAWLFERAYDLADKHIALMLATIAALGVKADAQKLARRQSRPAEKAAATGAA